MITVDNIQQLSPEWFAARCGIPSSSNFDKIVTSAGAPSKQAQKYMYQLVAERITGFKETGYTNDTMKRGIELEGEARGLFEIITENDVKQVGLCYDDDKKYLCSPDGLLGDCGLELKNPLSHTHVSYLLNNQQLVKDYHHQVQGAMLVTGFFHWWLMSHYPRLPPLIIKVERDALFCAALKKALDQFCADLDNLTGQIRNMG